MDLAIIIVSYNTRNLTAQCLTSVYDSLADSNLAAEVWVVDNASSDRSAAMVKRRFKAAQVLARKDNLGFAGGTNLALEQLAGLDEPPRHVLLLNPDTVVEGDAIARMVAFLDRHPEVAVVGPRLTYGDGSFQHSAFHFPTLTMLAFDFWPPHNRLIDSGLNGRYTPRRYAGGKPFAVDHPLGAALMIRWSTIQEIGPLDTDFFMYCEEIDWCMRARMTGRFVYCLPDAHIVHLGGQSTAQFRDEMFVALWRSRYLLFDKYYNRSYRFLARQLVRWGLHRASVRLQDGIVRGTVNAIEAAPQLAAYRTVMEM
jgi:N-acetylglucosaminyl-diphospho-decaprenol L-rhamnosyltransferase